MGLVPRAWSCRALCRSRRARTVVCSLTLGVALAAIVAGHYGRRSFLTRRLVLGGESAGFEYMVVGNQADVVTPTRPGLVLEGGGTDIDESFKWMIERSGGGDFLVIRTSGTDAYNDYIYDMVAPSGRCADSVATLIVASRAASFDPFVIKTVRRAEAIWIAGGDQSKQLAVWRGTPVARAIDELAARGVPVGGTSAGLAVMGGSIYSAEADGGGADHLTSTQALRDPYHPRVTIRRDFLHLTHLGGVLLEPHFVQESRYGRMAAFLARIAAECPRREARGVGIDRKTALLVEPDGSARVITGPDHPFGTATLFRLTTRPGVCEPGRPLTASGIEAVEFGSGDRLDLSRWGGEAGAEFRLSIDEGVPKIERPTK